MTPEEYDYWLRKKHAYEFNLKIGLGHKESIQKLLEKIEKKLSTKVVVV